MPRRHDGTEVILAALVDGARGDGHRTIARRMHRAPGTVREWLRRARRDAGAIQRGASAMVYALESPGLEASVPYTGSPLTDAVETLGRAISAVIREFGPRYDPCQLAVKITVGLIARQQPAPP